MNVDKLREEAAGGGYALDFSVYLDRNPEYLTLEDKTARFIINTMDQIVDGRASYVRRPDHSPFNLLNKEYAFYSHVVMRDEPAAKGTMVLTSGPTVDLMLERHVKGWETQLVNNLAMVFQKVGGVIQSASDYVNNTDFLPKDGQVHNAFVVILPYKTALCQLVADYEETPVVDAVRWPQEGKPHWQKLLTIAGYTLSPGGSAYTRTFEPQTQETWMLGRPHAVRFVRGHEEL